MKTLADIYTSIISSRFPRIRCILGPDDSIVALGVTDAVRRELANIIIDELGDEVRKRGFQFHGVMTLNPETSAMNYPKEWQAMQNELAAIDSTKQALLKYALVSPKTSESWITQALCGSTDVHAPISTFQGRSNLIRRSSGRYANVTLSKSNTLPIDDSEFLGRAE